MNIPNKENRGTWEGTLWKTLWKGKENIRHKFSRARTKGGELLKGDKKIHGEGGWFMVGFGYHSCLSFTTIGEGHMGMGRGKHLVVITSEPVGGISNPD